MTASIYSLWRFIFIIISFFLLSAGNRSFCLFFHFVVRQGIEGTMLCRILKTRIKHRYFTRGKSFESGTSLAASCAHELRYQTAKSCAFFFGKAKIRRENKMKKTSKQDTGFVPRQIQIWKCAKPSESVRSAVKSQQQVLNTVCKMYCVCKMQ